MLSSVNLEGKELSWHQDFHSLACIARIQPYKSKVIRVEITCKKRAILAQRMSIACVGKKRLESRLWLQWQKENRTWMRHYQTNVALSWAVLSKVRLSTKPRLKTCWALCLLNVSSVSSSIFKGILFSRQWASFEEPTLNNWYFT